MSGTRGWLGPTTDIVSYHQRVLLTEDALSSLVVQKILVDAMMQDIGLRSESDLTRSINSFTDVLETLSVKTESTLSLLSAIDSQVLACESCAQQLSAVPVRASQTLPQLRADALKSAIQNQIGVLHELRFQHEQTLSEANRRTLEVQSFTSIFLRVRSKFDALSLQLQFFYDFKCFFAGLCDGK